MNGRHVGPSLLLLCVLSLGAAGCGLASHALVVTRPAPESSATLVLATETRAPTPTVDDLVRILEASDAASSGYAPGSPAYDEFPRAVAQLAALNASTNNAASELAYAIGFPRDDSYLAAQALISLGPNWTATTLPILMDHLKNPTPRVRMDSALVLSTIGTTGSCALGNVGPLLWDSDPYVGSSIALAVQSLSGKQLVAQTLLAAPADLSASPVAPDVPDGRIVATARAWWVEHGSKINWHPSYDLCDPELHASSPAHGWFILSSPLDLD